MVIHDITIPLFPGMVSYPGDPPFQSEPVYSIDKDGYGLSMLSMGSHCGTHLDAPSHCLTGGGSVDRIPLELLIGAARVIEVAAAGSILPDHLIPKGIREGERILFKTRNSGLLKDPMFQPEYTYLSSEAAEYLAAKKVQLVGIDYLSIDDSTSSAYSSHTILLSGNSAVLEGLDLSEVNEGDYFLVALPLKIRDCDGSPVRAVLIEGMNL